MKETIYVYSPRGEWDMYAFRSFERALEKLLEDEGYATIERYIGDLGEWTYSYKPEEGYFSVDEGSEIRRVDLR